MSDIFHATDPLRHDSIVSLHDALLSALVNRVDRNLELLCNTASKRKRANQLWTPKAQIRPYTDSLIAIEAYPQSAPCSNPS